MGIKKEYFVAGGLILTLIILNFYYKNDVQNVDFSPLLPSQEIVIEGTNRVDTIEDYRIDGDVYIRHSARPSFFGVHVTIYPCPLRQLFVRTKGGNDMIRLDDCIPVPEEEGKYGIEVSAGFGNDVVRTGNGRDSVYGDENNDYISTGDGADLVVGGPGRDTLYGGNEEDKMFGGNNDDFMYGGNGDDLMMGGHGDDLICGQNDYDQLYDDLDRQITDGPDGLRDRLGGGDGPDELSIGGRPGIEANGDRAYGGNPIDIEPPYKDRIIGCGTVAGLPPQENCEKNFFKEDNYCGDIPRVSI